jgi:hypothetical protein
VLLEDEDVSLAAGGGMKSEGSESSSTVLKSAAMSAAVVGKSSGALDLRVIAWLAQIFDAGITH